MWQRRRAVAIVGLMLVAIGLVWIGQGMGLLHGASFMVDDPLWAVAGGVFAIAGLVLLVVGRRGHGRAS
jgi:hypothetical protein